MNASFPSLCWRAVACSGAATDRIPGRVVGMISRGLTRPVSAVSLWNWEKFRLVNVFVSNKFLGFSGHNNLVAVASDLTNILWIRVRLPTIR